METYYLSDIWRIRNAKSKWSLFTEKHSLGFIQSSLDYILISNILQENVTMEEILTSISTDNSPVFFFISKVRTANKVKGFWKFNSALTKD